MKSFENTHPVSINTISGSSPQKHVPSPSLFKAFRTELIKFHHSPLLYAQGLIAWGITVLFLAYYAFSPQGSSVKISAYVQTLAVGMPFLIGLFCGLAAEQECRAGNFSHILGALSRPPVLTAKVLVSFFLGTVSLLAALSLFALVMYALGQNPFSFTLYLYESALMSVGSLALYFLLFIIAFSLGKNAAIGIGISGSLIAALMITGLGEGLWVFIPFAWPVRFVSSLLTLATLTMGGAPSPLSAELYFDLGKGLIGCSILTLICWGAFHLWTHRFEGGFLHK